MVTLLSLKSKGRSKEFPWGPPFSHQSAILSTVLKLLGLFMEHSKVINSKSYKNMLMHAVFVSITALYPQTRVSSFEDSSMWLEELSIELIAVTRAECSFYWTSIVPESIIFDSQQIYYFIFEVYFFVFKAFLFKLCPCQYTCTGYDGAHPVFVLPSKM